MGEQGEEIPGHIKLQLSRSSFIEVISENDLKQRAVRVAVAVGLTALPRGLLLLTSW